MMNSHYYIHICMIWDKILFQNINVNITGGEFDFINVLTVPIPACVSCNTPTKSERTLSDRSVSCL